MSTATARAYRSNFTGRMHRPEAAKALKSSLFMGIGVLLPGKHMVSKIESC